MRTGLLLVAKREFRSILFSVRMVIICILMFLVLVGASYGLAYSITHGIEIAGLVLVRDAETFVMFLAGLLYYFGAIAVITLSFDSISGERINRTLPLLLVRPLSWREIALGKFLGMLGAVSLPVVSFSILGLGVFSWVSGMPVPALGAAALLGYTVLYLGIFISLEITLSSLTKRVGTSMLAGMMLWLVFVAFWSLIPAGYAYANNIPIDPGVRQYRFIIDWFSLGNPGVIYPTAVGQVMDLVREKPFPDWTAPVTMLLWFFWSLLAAVEVFNWQAKE